MKRLSLVAVAILLLSGCASETTYESPSALLKAYVAAGRDCPNPSAVPEAWVVEGAHGLLCPGADFLIVFDSEASKNRYLALTLDGSSELQAVVGERWVVVTSDAKELAEKLGGEVKTG